MSSVLCNCVNLFLDSWGFHSPILLGSLGSPLPYVQCRSQQAPQRWNVGSDSRVPLTLFWPLILHHEFVFAMSTKAPVLSKLIPCSEIVSSFVNQRSVFPTQHCLDFSPVRSHYRKASTTLIAAFLSCPPSSAFPGILVFPPQCENLIDRPSTKSLN